MGIIKFKILTSRELTSIEKKVHVENVGTGLASLEKTPDFEYRPFVFYDSSLEYEKKEIPAIFKDGHGYTSLNVMWKDCDRSEYFLYNTRGWNLAKPLTFPIMVGFNYDDDFDINKYLVCSDGKFNIIEYGNYPQSIVDFETQLKLTKAISNNKLISSGNTYTFYLTDIREWANMQEYIYDGERYVLLYAYGNASHWIEHDRCCYMDSKEYTFTRHNDSSVGPGIWFKVEPIRWFVDEETHTCLSEKVLFRLTKRQFKSEKVLNNNFGREIVQIISDEYKNTDIDEIKELLDKIYDTVSILPDDFQKLIVKKVDDLIQRYTSKCEENEVTSLVLNPNNNINLVLGEKQNNNNIKLIIELRNILYFLSKNNEYKELINEIDSYQKLLEKDVTKYSDEMNTVDDIIVAILYYACLMDSGNKKKIINKVGELINKPKDEFFKFLNSNFGDTTYLTVDYESNPRLNLKLVLSNYLDQVKLFYFDNERYFKLLGSFNQNSSTYNDEIVSILDVIQNIHYILSTEVQAKFNWSLSRAHVNYLLDKEKGNYKYKLIYELYVIEKKYAERIIDAVNNTHEDYEKIVIDMYQELQPFLIHMNYYVCNKKIIDDVHESMRVLLNLMPSEKGNKSVIISITNDIIQMINTYDLNSEEISDVRNQVNNYLKNVIRLLETDITDTLTTKVIDSGKDNEKINMIYRDYMSLYVDIKLLILKNMHDKENISANKKITKFLTDYQNEKAKKLKK